MAVDIPTKARIDSGIHGTLRNLHNHLSATPHVKLSFVYPFMPWMYEAVYANLQQPLYELKEKDNDIIFMYIV